MGGNPQTVYCVPTVTQGMDARRGAFALVTLVTAIMAIRGLVAFRNGDLGTVGRQLGVGGIVLAFGIGLVRHWDDIG